MPSIEERTARLEEAVEFIKEAFSDIKDNHLKGIYGKLDSLVTDIHNITVKMNSPRPSWLITVVITALCSLCVGLIVAFMMGRQ